MSEKAVKIYEETLKEQHSRNEARRIRARVVEARQSLSSAGTRWPFELLQNALDFGPRIGNSSVAISLSSDQNIVAFEHNGVPFTSGDLAALLTGGSSKEFESEVTTGRFGTGFLVTHVLAERTRLQGLLETPDGYEGFDLLLDRGGNEEAILNNMETCTEAIRTATLVPELKGIASARFEYHIEDANPFILGIASLTSALPYVYSTRQALGRVELQKESEDSEVWEPTDISAYTFDDGYVEERFLRIEQDGDTSSEVCVLRFMTSEHGSAAALVLVKRAPGGWRVVPPEPNAPRVYREYPLRGTGFLPLNFILDGKFEPDQERDTLLMSDKDKELIIDAFAAAVAAVKFAVDHKWEDAHLLVQVSEPLKAFEPSNSEEGDWWFQQLASFAERVAELPVVDCSSRLLPAINPKGDCADFLIPSLSVDSNEVETTVERMWPLAESATGLLPPKRELTATWTKIVQGWHGLGVQVNRVSVSDLREWVRGEAGTLDEMQVSGNPEQWMTLFLDVVGECWKRRSGIDLSVLHGMLPDQNERLRSPSDLSRDGGIPDSLKYICSEIGLDLRGQLLLGGFQEDSDKCSASYLQYVLDNALPNSISEDEAIDKAVVSLDAALPEDEPCDGTPTKVQISSVRLLNYLWEARGENAAQVARRVPLITRGQVAVRSTPSRMMMAPVRSWNESAQPFANAYPPNRVLAETYAGSPSEGLQGCVSALVKWQIAIADPISTFTPSEITDRRLAELSSQDTNGVTVTNNNEEFSQIALLTPEIINRCQGGIDAARALLGLIICHAAPHDPAWKEERTVKGRKSGQQVEVPITAALWLADLKTRPWVPVPGEDGKLIPMPANSTTLNDLLDPEWLKHNNAAIELLSLRFGFDQLELQLLGIEPNDQKREQLRDGLAKLVEYGGADPSLYSSLAEELESRQRRQRDIDYFRSLGIAVQEAVKSAMESYNLDLNFVDHGFDYEVTIPDDVFGDVSLRYDVGPYLLEVKATTTGQVRLTSLQAETASSESDRYVLCVVDLRSVHVDQLAVEWSGPMVEPLARIVPEIGSRIRGTYSLVAAARARSIAVRNDSALRYEVPSEVWETGTSICEWISEVAGLDGVVGVG